MDPSSLTSRCVLATALVVLLGGCSSTAKSGGSGGQSQGGAKGDGGQAGQTTTPAAGGSSAGTGGQSSQGGQTTLPATGGSAGAGGVGGKTGQGGTAGQADAAAGAGGSGGQGGTTSTPPADAADVAGGAGGSPSSDGGGGAGGAGKDAQTDAPAVGHPRRVLLADEGNRRILLMDLENATTPVWTRQLNDPTKDGDSMRDMQLVGGDRVAVSVAKGYVELDLKTGEIKKEVSSFDGVESLRRLPSGNTILGSNSNGGVTLQELDSQDTPVTGHKVTFTNYSQLRLFRRTPQGTFLLGVGAKLAEVNWDKQSLWEMTIPAGDWVYQGLRLPDKSIVTTSGYGSTLLIIDATAKKALTTIGGKNQPDASTIVPNFYGGFQVLANGHFVVTNWEGHGAGNGGKGIQLLEYDASGALVWKWKQDPALVSSLHNALVLDGLDTTKLHDDVNGALAPVTQ